MRLLTSLIAALLLLALWVSPAEAQWTPDSTVVLKGKIVSMHRSVRSGQVVIKNGKIEAILAPTAAVPDDAIVIDTKGYIYPGLINLHNHLRYNFLGLYPLPKHTDNHNEWGGDKTYSEHVNNPSQIVTGRNYFDRLEEALKFAEVRAIVGGETTTQGGENNPAIKYTLVRNVELGNFGEDKIGQRAFAMDPLFYKHLDETRPNIKASDAWIYHMAEGIDEIARREWTFPEFDPDKKISVSKSAFNLPGAVEADLVWPGLVGVHCTAMGRDDFRQWREIAGSAPKIVWSPTSNLMLYGKTTDIRTATQEGAMIALGTDWSPSGTKNLLWELKMADEYNRTQSPRLWRGYKALIEMVTTTPAKMVGWDDKVGQIREGFYADILVTDRLNASGYKNLVLANEANVQLVFVGGNPLYGDVKHMDRLKVYGGQPRYEVLPDSPGGRPKAIDMLEDPEVRAGDMSLAQVRERLEEALALDADALAAHVNAGVQETATRTTYKARDYLKAELAKQLERDDQEVPENLTDEDADITPEQVAQLLELKFPHLEKIDSVDTLFTDERFMDELESNVHWKEHGVTISLRGYDLPAPSDAELTGLVEALEDATSED